ncbi:hypothetical protein FVE85_2204 [Porphyridium purpureum]|uniref:GST N-terminal domain-containing protein n=1 Tax=Porphyridium purpureum TaxID=35688 RepID=A0A5J4YWV9_PORPP|nr:hypothetical protein FVE85_2204 [Porphyridium purpureum]|eukprot:POR8589..scf209_3
MAFLAAGVLHRPQVSALRAAKCAPRGAYRQLRRTMTTVKMADAGEATGEQVAAGPVVPEGFKPPTPKTFQVRPDQLLNIVSGSVSSLARAYSGAVVDGYSLSIKNGSLSEKSTTLPAARPAQPLVLFDIESCPFCRKVREALCILDLEVYIYPAPRGGVRFRPLLEEMAGKSQFPYLIDPNTDFAAYESDDIVTYLFKTYGDGSVPLALRLGPLTNISASVSSGLRAGRGMSTPSKKVFPEKALQLWGYEPSPFVKIVREKLCELELPYLLYNTARGSPQRITLKERVGRFQVPYLEDENTGVKMFESAEIVEYLEMVYGDKAAGATAKVPDGLKGVMPKLQSSDKADN